MRQNDKLENYIFIRHKLFRIIISKDFEVGYSGLAAWKKNVLDLDFGKGAWKKVRVVNDPLELSEELKDFYITYLEMKVYSWQQLLVKD